jgi:hypothetical protein
MTNILGALADYFLQHCSIAAVSSCTLISIQQYFVNGTLPEEGTWCPINQALFPERTINMQPITESEYTRQTHIKVAEDPMLRLARKMNERYIPEKLLPFSHGLLL